MCRGPAWGRERANERASLLTYVRSVWGKTRLASDSGSTSERACPLAFHITLQDQLWSVSTSSVEFACHRGGASKSRALSAAVSHSPSQYRYSNSAQYVFVTPSLDQTRLTRLAYVDIITIFVIKHLLVSSCAWNPKYPGASARI
jgi:hypothetical protein